MGQNPGEGREVETERSLKGSVQGGVFLQFLIKFDLFP
jgi:hypothetical protein